MRDAPPPRYPSFRENPSRDKPLTTEQTVAYLAHKQEFINANVAANNTLIQRLLAIPEFTDGNKASLKNWSILNNHIHLQFDRQVAKLGECGLSTEKLATLAQLTAGVIKDVAFANAQLREGLLASADLAEAVRATLDEWTLVLGDIVAFSEAHVMEIQSGAAPKRLQ